ncbi:SixA phosphatase family protein [Nocardioides nematodiphilus]|uniref:SixA phosphatase family protein n=1 Tax=Nocardioides nematodiphilus TaxID=2849669 RepID=UPI001CD9281A|nr:histidine phosphatase family protein [Nocardioides nematodiphilus]MCA1981912.1 histidine phosphatase family protein [Nocardioides nematodiphilus]
MRTLVIMRHAKAEASAPTDFERRLTDRGHADALEAGGWLAERVAAPDDALVSGAARTSETWEDVATGAGWDLDVAQHVDALYSAGSDATLDLIRDTDDTTQTLVVIGHNPTVGMLAQLLDDGNGDEEASIDLVSGFPTSAVAVFEVDGDWDELEEAGGTLVAYHVGRG